MANLNRQWRLNGLSRRLTHNLVTFRIAGPPSPQDGHNGLWQFLPTWSELVVESWQGGEEVFSGEHKTLRLPQCVAYTAQTAVPRYFDIRYRYLEQPEEKTYNTDLNLYGEANAILALTAGVMAWRL